jgi:hypothetical protein
MIVIFKVLQKGLRKLIDWLMTTWLWANKRQKAAEERKKYGRK